MSRRARRPCSPQVFDLTPTEGLKLALFVAAVSVAVAVLCAIFFGVGFVVLVVGIAPALFYLVSGAPNAIEVHEDRVVIRYAMRKDRTIPAGELTLQRLPGELVLIHGNDTILFDAESVHEGALDRCGDAIEAVAHETIHRAQVRPRA
ncbi:MAG: hypothetical protein AB7S26_39720 [Sandaracinaceae bacterium]